MAGNGHFCVLVQSGEVGCWGDSTYGQTGYMAELALPDMSELAEPQRNRSKPPTKFLKFDSPAKQIATSGFTSCALLEDGKLWCWGDTDAFAFEDPNEPTFHERLASKNIHPLGRRLPKPLGASTLPHSPVKLSSACTVKDFRFVSEQLCVSCEGGCSKCWGKTAEVLDVEKVQPAEPPAECLTY